MAVERTINIELDASDAISDLKKVRGEIDITYAELRKTTPIELDGSKAKSELKSVGSEIGKTAEGAKKIGKSAEGSVGGFKKLKISTQAFGLALKATGIGLIVALFVKLQDALSKNQVVMDTFNVVTENISITFQKLINTLVETTQKVLGFFSKVGKIIKTFVSQDLDGLAGGYDRVSSASDKLEGKTKSLGRQMVELRNEVKLAEAEQRLLQLTYQKDAELQRQIRDDVSLTMKERIEANEKLGSILDKQFLEEQAIAQKKIDLAEMELSKNKGNIDLQVALINAKTEMADLDERITGQRSEQLINLTTLQREQADALQAIQDKKNQEAKKAQEIIDAQLAAEQKAAAELLALKEKEAEEELALWLKKEAARNKDLADQKIAADKAIEIAKAEALEKAEIERKLGETRRAIVANSLGQVASLMGEESKAGKALAVGQALINTYSAAAAALAPPPIGAGPIFGPIAAIGAIAAGMANVKSILSTKIPGVSDGGGGGGAEPAVPGGMGPLTPNMENIQGAELGGGDSQVQAFVVENDISNAQALQEELDLQSTL